MQESVAEAFTPLDSSTTALIADEVADVRRFEDRPDGASTG